MSGINALLSSELSDQNRLDDSKIDLLSPATLKKIRRLTNVFEIEKVVQGASCEEFERASFIWNQICRYCEVVMSDEIAGIGLTTRRKFRAGFGPPILSVIITALQTGGGAQFLEIFRILEREIDELECAKFAGAWRSLEELKTFIEQRSSKEVSGIPKLWNEFWSKIDTA